MYGFIFGFQRRARLPKCTPASIKSLTTKDTEVFPSPYLILFPNAAPHVEIHWGIRAKPLLCRRLSYTCTSVLAKSSYIEYRQQNYINYMPDVFSVNPKLILFSRFQISGSRILIFFSRCKLFFAKKLKII